MKKLLAAALVFTVTSAHAERWFEMKNNAGGKIILTEYKCEGTKEGKLAIATMDTGKSLDGCWFYFVDMVHVVWKTGDKSTFEPKDFVARESK